MLENKKHYGYLYCEYSTKHGGWCVFEKISETQSVVRSYASNSERECNIKRDIWQNEISNHLIPNFNC